MIEDGLVGTEVGNVVWLVPCPIVVCMVSWILQLIALGVFDLGLCLTTFGQVSRKLLMTGVQLCVGVNPVSLRIVIRGARHQGCLVAHPVDVGKREVLLVSY